MTTSTNLINLRKWVKNDLANLDATIHESLHSDIASINSISQHITQNPGKRLRPLLTLLTAKACGYKGDAHILLAAIIELIHTATLLHDDVVDESTQRRGHITANAKWGNAISVLVGDFLYSRSFQLMARLNHPQVFHTLADTTNTIAEGEVLQLTQSCKTDLTEQTYLQVIHHKTAKLFESACHLSALVADMPPQTIQALRLYGQQFGMAYQLMDDILDYTGSGSLGKNTGDDFREGKLTLPLIDTLKKANQSERRQLENHINGKCPMAFEEALQLMRRHNAFEYAQSLAISQSREAGKALNEIAPSPYRDALESLLTFIINRDH